MSKQLKKLSYEPETITLDVSSAITTDSGTLTISQIKVLLENAKNTITYQTSANYSEVLHLAQADYENVAAPKATYTADYYDSSTNVYYKHIIVVSYNTLFNSATWVFVSAPMVSGSSSDLQEKLVSGTNIKTINGNNVLGSGNLAINEFPERSETDATLAQIAGLNSNGHPDVGKVAAANMDSGSATAGQVPVADGSGGVAWGNKQDTLTASSVTDGTIAKAIGFDSSNNLVKGTVGGGGGTQLYKHTMRIRIPGGINYCYFLSNTDTLVMYKSPDEPAPITGFMFTGMIIPYTESDWINVPPYSIIKIDNGTSTFHYFDYTDNSIKSHTIANFLDDTVTAL